MSLRGAGGEGWGRWVDQASGSADSAVMPTQGKEFVEELPGSWRVVASKKPGFPPEERSGETGPAR
jgi:hypothetical protein